MKIIILHGDDTIKSYIRLSKFMTEAKKRNWEVTDYNNDSVSNQTLFGNERFFILKDYKSLDKKQIKKIEKYDGNLIIYHEGSIPVTFIKLLPKDTKIEKFELPQLLWKFLDCFDGRNNYTLKIFHDLLKTQPVEFILAMIAWKLRKKYRAKPTPEVELLILELAEIDVKAKTGKAKLKDSLDLFVIKRLG